MYNTASAQSRNLGVVLTVASRVVNTYKEPLKRFNNAHCGWSYAFSAYTQVEISWRIRSLMARPQEALGRGLVVLTQYASVRVARLKAPS